MKKLLIAASFWLAAAFPALCQGTIPVALTQQINANGQPLAGALLFTFVAGTVAQQQNTFQDTALTLPNPWPLVADQTGRIPMFYMASGSTHVRLTDASGNVQFDYPTMLVIGPAGGGGGGGGSVDPTTVLATGDLKVKYGTGILTGFVRSNGLTIGNATSGASERANSDTQNLFVYLYGVDPNLVVSGGRTGNALNDYNSNKTIALPDWRDRAIAGLGDMGNSDAGRLTAAIFGSSPTLLGASGGGQSLTLARSDLPNVAPSFAGAPQTVNLNQGNILQFAGGFFGGVTSGGGGGVVFNSSGPSQITPTVTFTPGGTVQSLNGNVGQTSPSTVQPTMLATIYLKL